MPWKCGYRLVMQVISNNTSFVGSGIKTGVVFRGWLSKWGTTLASRMFYRYICPLWLPLTVMRSSLQSYDTHSPHHDWASSERNSFCNVTLSISSVRLSPYAYSAISHVQQEATLVRPMNFPQWGQISLTTCLTPL